MASVRPTLRAKPRATRPATFARAWTVAQELRGRRGWLLDNAHCQRTWSVRLGAARFEISAHVSLFFEYPGMVVALESSFPQGLSRAMTEDAMGHLRAALGPRYGSYPPADDRLVTKVPSDKPTKLLAELARVERIFGGRATRRFGRNPRSQDGRRWHSVEAMRATSWQFSSLSFTRALGDKDRALRAGIGASIDSESDRRGLIANFGGWVPRTSKRWTQFCDDTAAGLTAEGFRIQQQTPLFFQAGRWTAGLSAARALKQADELDELFDIGADVVFR